jgi:hypothetical protein
MQKEWRKEDDDMITWEIRRRRRRQRTVYLFARFSNTLFVQRHLFGYKVQSLLLGFSFCFTPLSEGLLFFSFLQSSQWGHL